MKGRAGPLRGSRSCLETASPRIRLTIREVSDRASPNHAGVPLTVGDILDFLDGWDRSDHVEVNIVGPPVYIHVPSDQLTIGSGQGGPTGEGIVVEISLNVEPQ